MNLSLGYEFDPSGSPAATARSAIEVDRLVRSGVVVVVAAGNSGYGASTPDVGDARSCGTAMTINDPGNARAGDHGRARRTATRPHIYGVSYFSSKGPTGDGRVQARPRRARASASRRPPPGSSCDRRG